MQGWRGRLTGERVTELERLIEIGMPDPSWALEVGGRQIRGRERLPQQGSTIDAGWIVDTTRFGHVEVSLQDTQGNVDVRSTADLARLDVERKVDGGGRSGVQAKEELLIDGNDNRHRIAG